jgi:hypothetical protein
LSAKKASVPGRKQIFRAFNARGGFFADLIGLADEGATTVATEFSVPPAETLGLLEKRLSDGNPLGARLALAETRERFLEVLGLLEGRYKELTEPAGYPVKFTRALNAMIISERMRAEERQK